MPRSKKLPLAGQDAILAEMNAAILSLKFFRPQDQVFISLASKPSIWCRKVRLDACRVNLLLRPDWLERVYPQERGRLECPVTGRPRGTLTLGDSPIVRPEGAEDARTIAVAYFKNRKYVATETIAILHGGRWFYGMTPGVAMSRALEQAAKDMGLDH